MGKINSRRKETSERNFGMSKYVIKNCPSCYYIYCDKEYECNWRGSGITKPCQDCTDCLLKQIVELCKEQKVINCNIDGKEQVLKAYYHTHLSDKILELLDIQEVE
jgi:hypothetical protein